MIVSNDVCNDVSPVIEVIFLTSRKKHPLPTHVNVQCELYSIALCEQITSVDKSRLLDYVGRASPEEMQQIDEAIKISLGIGIGGTGEEMGEVIAIDGIGIQIREHSGQRVLTLRDIDVVHKRTAGTAGRYFNQNKTRFREKKDYFLLKDEKSLSAEKVFTGSGYELLTGCYLATERDMKVRKEVIETYFTVAEETEDPAGTTTMEEPPKVEEPKPQEVTEYDPAIYLESAKIVAQLPESREYVLNCLRHVVPDIDVETQPVHEILEVKTELTTKQTETVKVKQTQKKNPNPKFFKVGVPCDVAKLKRTMERKNISDSRMALMSELSITTVKNILAEKHQPTIETRTKFCRALKVSDDYLTPGGGA